MIVWLIFRILKFSNIPENSYRNTRPLCSLLYIYIVCSLLCFVICTYYLLLCIFYYFLFFCWCFGFKKNIYIIQSCFFLIVFMFCCGFFPLYLQLTWFFPPDYNVNQIFIISTTIYIFINYNNIVYFQEKIIIYFISI